MTSVHPAESLQSLAYYVGPKKTKPTARQVYHGRDLCHQVVHEQKIVSVPATFGYLLAGWDGTPWHQMPAEWQRLRFEDLCMIPWGLVPSVQKEVRRFIDHPAKINSRQIDIIEPKDIASLVELSKDHKYEELGENLIRGGFLARVTLAGGQASRFVQEGYEGPRVPKALEKISDQAPFADKTYLSVIANDLLWTQLRYHPVNPIPWLLFVDPSHRKAIEQYLETKDHFDLDPDSILLMENTAYVPKFTGKGRIATTSDVRANIKPEEDRIEFYTSGHGTLATAFKENPIFIRGKMIDHSAYTELKSRGIRYLFQSNVDNLGARTRTGNYSIILGYYYSQESDIGCDMMVELTTPLIHESSIDPFWDEGGVALKVNDTSTIVDSNALGGDVLKKTRDPENPFPFNTANATWGIDSIPENAILPDLIQQRDGVYQLDRNFWNLTAEVNRTCFVQVPRDIPENLAMLPPAKPKRKPGRLIRPAPFSGAEKPIEHDNRFIPNKLWDHREHAAALYAYYVQTPAEKITSYKNTKRILVVDDEKTLRENMRMILSTDGWQQIIVAGSRQEAEDLLARENFDLVLLDSVLDTANQTGDTEGVAIVKAIKYDQQALNHKSVFVLWSSHESADASRGLSRFQIAELIKKGGFIFTQKDPHIKNLDKLSDYLIEVLSGSEMVI